MTLQRLKGRILTPAQQQRLGGGARVVANNKYVVIVREHEPDPTKPRWHLSIRREDRKPIRDWRDLQAIKNQVCGAEAVGFEVFPPESLLMDTSNQYHLWVYENADACPFLLRDGRFVANKSDPSE
jgi:hypothetical protein